MDNSKIHEALMAVQSELKAPKGQMNTFGGYKYRSCEDILEAVKPILKEHGLLLTISDEPKVLEGWHYIEATAKVEALDGGCVTVTAYAREPEQKTKMDAAQVTGTSSSYARKYALNGLFCIDDTKDADTDEYQKQTASRASKPAQKQPEAETIPPCLSGYAVSGFICGGCQRVKRGKVKRGAGSVVPYTRAMAAAFVISRNGAGGIIDLFIVHHGFVLLFCGGVVVYILCTFTIIHD